MKGLNELLSNLSRFERNAETELKNIVNKTAINIHADAVELIQNGDKTGVVYGNHQASAEGEAPATDTGALVSSLKLKQASQLTAHVYTNLKYAPYLEFGTANMGERPFMYPALKMNEKQFYRELDGLVKKASKGLL